MDNLHHLCIGFDNWTQVGFDSEDPKFSFGARQLEKGASEAPEGMERAGIWDENGVWRPGLRCYGFFLGSPEYVRHKLRGEAERICTEIDKVMHLLRNDLQSAWAILSSALAHQLDYSLSLQYPSDSLECAQIVDGRIWSAMEQLADQPHIA